MTDVNHETDEQWRMTDRISIPALRRQAERDPYSSPIKHANLLALVEAVEAAHEHHGGARGDHGLADLRAARTCSLCQALARFDFGEEA